MTVVDPAAPAAPSPTTTAPAAEPTIGAPPTPTVAAPAVDAREQEKIDRAQLDAERKAEQRTALVVKMAAGIFVVAHARDPNVRPADSIKQAQAFASEIEKAFPGLEADW